MDLRFVKPVGLLPCVCMRETQRDTERQSKTEQER